jgi:hypothetical protein
MHTSQPIHVTDSVRLSGICGHFSGSVLDNKSNTIKSVQRLVPWTWYCTLFGWVTSLGFLRLGPGPFQRKFPPLKYQVSGCSMIALMHFCVQRWSSHVTAVMIPVDTSCTFILRRGCGGHWLFVGQACPSSVTTHGDRRGYIRAGIWMVLMI